MSTSVNDHAPGGDGELSGADDGRPRTYSFGDFCFSTSPPRLTRGRERIELRPQAARLLRLLLEHAGEVVSREEIRLAVWGHGVHVAFDQGINFNVRQIRTALGESARDTQFIETVPRQGYRFAHPVSVQADVSEGPVARRRRPIVLAGLLVVSSVAVLVGALNLRTAGPRASVVVPPFAAVQAGVDASVGRRVVVNALHTQAADLVRVTSSDHAGLELRGAVSAPGDSGEILVRLVRRADDTPVWHRAGTLAEFESIDWVSALEQALDHRRRPPWTDPAARDAVIRARLLIDEGRAARRDEAIVELERALALEPEDHEAMASLAEVLLESGQREQARAAYLRLIEIDPTHPRAHLGLGALAFRVDRDLDRGERHWRTAIAMDPGSVRPRMHLAWLLAARGLVEEAVDTVEAAAEVAPLDTWKRREACHIYLLAGDWERAVSMGLDTIRLDPRDQWGSRCAIEGRLAQGLDAEAVELMNGYLVAWGGQESSVANAEEFWRVKLNWKSMWPSERALAHLRVDEPEEAFAVLRDACRHRRGWFMPTLTVDPRFDSYREMAEFREVLTCVAGGE